MFSFLKCCFSRTAKRLTCGVSLNRWRSVTQVLFKSRHPQATELRDLSERHVRFVLRRLGRLVPRAVVQMSDVNGPRGGIDKRCRVELRNDGAGSVVFASVASDWRTALDNELARAAHFLMRLWRVAESAQPAEKSVQRGLAIRCLASAWQAGSEVGSRLPLAASGNDA